MLLKNLIMKGSYNYSYCTKSSHFRYVLEEALLNDNIHIETSSAFDIDIVKVTKKTRKTKRLVPLFYVMALKGINTLANIVEPHRRRS